MTKKSYPNVRVKSVKQPQALLGNSSPYIAGGGSDNEAMVNWHPSLRSADADITRDRRAIVSRSRDLVRNNGWASGAIEKEVDAIVGSSLRPLLKPNWRMLGLDEGWAREFKLIVEARWKAYAEDPRHYADVTRSMSLPRLFGMGFRNYLMEGDALGVLHWRTDRPTHTTLRVMDPDQLSNPLDQADSKLQRGGVELDNDEAAIAYHFRLAHENQDWSDQDAFQWERVSREQPWGRPLVIHFFDKHRDGQTRGVSKLAPVIEKLRMEDNYGRVELQAAVLNAVLGAFVKSPMDPEFITDMFDEGADQEGGAWRKYTQSRGQYYENKGGIRMGGVKLPHLYPGEEIGVIQAARPAAQFADFESAVLRNIASGLNISYEQLSADWSKTNYSSARAAMVEIWRGWTSKRKAFAQGFCQPFFMAWLEEEIDRGFIELPANAPDFRENWAAYSQAKWIGPGKGFVDPVKEAQAAAMRVALGLSTLEDEAAELTGSDFSENLTQIENEIGQLPEGVLHPMQESFAKLIGGAAFMPQQQEQA